MKDISEKFLRYIGDSCIASETDGSLRCRYCISHVDVDWFENTLECLGCDEL